MNKKILAVAVSSALAAPMAAHAVKYKLSGQVNRAIVYTDDGEGSDVQFIDNGSSGTRWRMKGSEDIGNGMKVGFNWEWQRSSNGGGGAIGSGDAAAASNTMRKAGTGFHLLLRLLVPRHAGGWLPVHSLPSRSLLVGNLRRPDRGARRRSAGERPGEVLRPARRGLHAADHVKQHAVHFLGEHSGLGATQPGAGAAVSRQGAGR